MGTVKTWILIIVLLIALIIGVGYLIRKKSYETIDELDKEKNSILKHAPYDKIRTIENMAITGQSDEYREQLLAQWREIEKEKYPSVENHLFDAEQATDRLHFPKARTEQKLAKEKLAQINEEMVSFEKLADDFILQEEANLERIDQIKEKYHEVRKRLLAQSFSFGEAAEKLEQQLTEMEDYFTQFTHLTVSGDHEEANHIIVQLNQKISTMEEQMTLIPQLFEKINTVYKEQLKEIEQGYHYFVKNGYVFVEDDILEAVKTINEQIEQLTGEIEALDFTNTENMQAAIEKAIDLQYQKMETELAAKPQVQNLRQNVKQALFYLKDEYQHLAKFAERLSESYYLQHNELQKLDQFISKLESEEKQYHVVDDRLISKELPYSEAQTLLERVFAQLKQSFEKIKKLRDTLENYRELELELKDDLTEMSQAMYEMKRRLESRRLPGLSEKYMELFFSTTKRLEALGKELSQPLLDTEAARKQHKMCQEDVEELSTWTEAIISQSALTEIISQRLLRYREDYPGVEETINYSQTLFRKDYDYESALQLVQEKMNQIAPDELAEILADYEQKNN